MVFADVIKPRISRWGHSGLVWTPNPMIGVLFRGRGRIETRREGYVRTVQSWKHVAPSQQMPRATTRSQERSNRFSLRVSRRSQPCHHPWLWTSGLQNSEGINLSYLRYLVCGIGYSSPSKPIHCHWASFLVPSSFRTKRESCLTSRRYPAGRNLIQLCRTLCLYPTVFMKKGKKLLGAVQVHLGLVKFLTVCFRDGYI